MTEEPKKKMGRPKGVKGKSTTFATSFKKGDVKNPHGRPKADHSLRDLIRKNHASVYDILMDMATDKTDFARQRFAIENILQRGWGRVPDAPHFDPENPDGGPNSSGVHIMINGRDANA